MYAVSCFQKVWLLIYMTYDKKKRVVRISYVGNIVHTASKTPVTKWNFSCLCNNYVVIIKSA